MKPGITHKALHTMWDFDRKRKKHISAGTNGLRPERIREDLARWLAGWEKTGLYGDDENFLNKGGLWQLCRRDLLAPQGGCDGLGNTASLHP